MKDNIILNICRAAGIVSILSPMCANCQTTSKPSQAKVNKVAEKKQTSKLAICQYCFWTGELKIGAIEGVTETEAGFMDGREVTLVKYDPTVITAEKILKQAKADDVASGIYLLDPSKLPGSKKFTGYRAAPKSDQKKQIQGTIFAGLDLTPQQATKVNAFARSNPQKAIKYLTPEQISQIKR